MTPVAELSSARFGNFCSLIVMESGWFPLSGIKSRLLRLFGAKIGAGVVFKPHVRIKYPWRLEIGDHCWIGQESWIDNLADVAIGDHVCVSQKSYLCTGSHDHRRSTFDLITGTIRVESGAWLGARCTVLQNVVIGADAIVAGGSVVHKDVEPAAIVGGQSGQSDRPTEARVNKRLNNQTRSAALVTGCSTGIGRATVHLLAEQGWLVLAGVRNAKDAQSLRALPGVEPLLVDVTCPDQVAAAAERTDELAPEGLTALVNNAGLALPSPVELTSARPTPPFVGSQYRRRVANDSSLLPSQSSPPHGTHRQCFVDERHDRAPHGRSLFGVKSSRSKRSPTPSASSSDRGESRCRSSARVQVQTAIFDKARDALQASAEDIPEQLREGYRPLYEAAAKFNERGATSAAHPEMVARAVHRALTARWPKARYVVGWDAWGLQLAKRCIPVRLLDRALARACGVFHRV